MQSFIATPFNADPSCVAGLKPPLVIIAHRETSSNPRRMGIATS
jgi:hypothetical protein